MEEQEASNRYQPQYNLYVPTGSGFQHRLKETTEWFAKTDLHISSAGVIRNIAKWSQNAQLSSKATRPRHPSDQPRPETPTRPPNSVTWTPARPQPRTKVGTGAKSRTTTCAGSRVRTESYPIACNQLARVEQVVRFKVKRSTRRHHFVCFRVQFRIPAREKDSDDRHKDPDSQPDPSSGGRQTFGGAAMACVAFVHQQHKCYTLGSMLQDISDTNALVLKQTCDKIVSAFTSLCPCLRRGGELAETPADAP